MNPEPYNTNPARFTSLNHWQQIAIAARCCRRMSGLLAFRKIDGTEASEYVRTLSFGIDALAWGASQRSLERIHQARSNIQAILRNLRSAISTESSLLAAETISHSLWIATFEDSEARAMQLAGIIRQSAWAAEVAYRSSRGGLKFEVVDASQGIVKANLRVGAYSHICRSSIEADLRWLHKHGRDRPAFWKDEDNADSPNISSYFSRFLWAQAPGSELEEWTLIEDFRSKSDFPPPDGDPPVFDGKTKEEDILRMQDILWEHYWPEIWSRTCQHQRDTLDTLERPAKQTERTPDAIKLRIASPEFYEREEAASAIAELAQGLSDLHRSFGGSGLKFEGGEPFTKIIQSQGVPLG